VEHHCLFCFEILMLNVVERKGIDMEMKEFVQKVQYAVEKRVGEGVQVKVHEIHKNNNTVFQGLLIMSEGQNVSPTIYLNSFWEAYQQGVTLNVIIEHIMRVYRQDTPKENVDMSFFKEYDKVKDRICYKLISFERNRELLEKIPYFKFLDLAICFYYAYQGEELGEGSILIHNNHMEMWQVTRADLLDAAGQNTPSLFPCEVESMEDTLRQLMGICPEECDESEINFERALEMQIISNQSKIYGASCILYPDVLEKMSREAGKSLYVIPSSVHEMLVLPDDGWEDGRHLQKMIAEVNDTQVEPEAVLSDCLYYYDIQDKQIRIF